MSYQKLLQQMIGVTLVVLLLAGCGAPAATPTPVPPTPMPTPTLTLTATPTPTPTLTATPTPPPTPTPTPNPVFHGGVEVIDYYLDTFRRQIPLSIQARLRDIKMALLAEDGAAVHKALDSASEDGKNWGIDVALSSNTYLFNIWQIYMEILNTLAADVPRQ